MSLFGKAWNEVGARLNGGATLQRLAANSPSPSHRPLHPGLSYQHGI